MSRRVRSGLLKKVELLLIVVGLLLRAGQDAMLLLLVVVLLLLLQLLLLLLVAIVEPPLGDVRCLCKGNQEGVTFLTICGLDFELRMYVYVHT